MRVHGSRYGRCRTYGGKREDDRRSCSGCSDGWRTNPPIWLKKKAMELLYDVGKYILETYNCYEQ